MNRFIKDLSVSAVVAGMITSLVGITSSAVLVYQAASAAGVGAEGAGSWLGSLCLGMGFLSIVLSLKYRTPVLIAWSTAGSALLVTGLPGIALSDAIGAFLFSALLIFLSGIAGVFAKVMNRIPLALASALLAGVLLHFALDAFVALKSQPLLVGSMLVSYLLMKRFSPRYAMMLVLTAGIAAAWALGLLHFADVQVTLTELHPVMPTFSPQVLLSVGVPLFLVTMASQNLTGLSVMRANGYSTPVSPLMACTGLTNLLVAPFGGFAINLAAITAAIAMGPESHPRPEKRYVAAVVSGVIYMCVGIAAGTVTSLFAAFPRELITAITGIALFSTIANGLKSALLDEGTRDAAFVTFAVTASGLTIFGVGSAFWGLAAGGLTTVVLSRR